VTEPQSRFWSFSLSVYGQADVRQECLELQDRHGLDVNMLLFCAFVGAVHGAILPERDLTELLAAVGDWHDGVVRALRNARRALKRFAGDRAPIGASAAALRTSVKAAELEAERIEQAMLEDWSVPRVGDWQRTEPGYAAAANIRTLLAICCDSAPPPLPDQLITVAAGAVRVTRG
jgi:uncharacterized protein (TIGR02444 family)